MNILLMLVERPGALITRDAEDPGSSYGLRTRSSNSEASAPP